MSVKVSLSIGEHYPHLFVSTDPSDIRWAESPEGSRHDTVAELSDEDYAAYLEAETRYYEWVGRLDALRKSAGGGT